MTLVWPNSSHFTALAVEHGLSWVAPTGSLLARGTKHHRVASTIASRKVEVISRSRRGGGLSGAPQRVWAEVMISVSRSDELDKTDRNLGEVLSINGA